METIIINGIKANLFNKTYNGMDALTFHLNDIKPLDVLKLEGVFLHPTESPNSIEIFALKGTQEQYDEFCKTHKQAYCSLIASAKYDILTEYEEFSKLQNELLSNYKFWFE